MTEPTIRTLTTSDGYQIHFRHWRARTPRGIVLAMHGIQSHSGWFEASSRAMADAGLDVYFADRRGSGLNGFQRGHAAHGMRLINDVRALRELARHEQNGPLPVISLGISWGGKTAAAAVALHPTEFNGLALLYPGLAPRVGPTMWQGLKLKLARSFEITKTDIPIPLRAPALFTDEPVWQQFIANDPLALHAVSSGLLNAGSDLDWILATRSAAINCPVLLMLAGRDRIIDNKRTRTLVTTFGSPHMTSICFPDACHTLEFEQNRESIFSQLTDWLDRKMLA